MCETDIYDIIIENITEGWNKSMSNGNLQKTKWELPKYSGKQIERAGKNIARSTQGEQDLEILNNWRASHAYPLQVITSNLRQNNPKAVVVQRLKRLDSIAGKLKRFPEMNLFRMQDLGGCRVIVDTVDEVYESLNKYKKSRIRHILKREDDYIKYPKESGYRSYHVVYQYYSDNNTTYNKNMFIEIQFRTKLQHMWATALETMGVYTRMALKASIGDENILRFFTLVSSVFAKMEKTTICPNTPDDYNELISEIKLIDEKLNIVSRISAISVSVKYVNEKYVKEKGYYLLLLNFNQKYLRVRRFGTSQIEMATNVYDKIEAQNSPDMDAVLVSATSLENLRLAYPNYFSDISEFVSTMRRITS